MDTLNAVVLCTYSYDPLDRLAAASPAGSDSVQRFYQKSRLTTEIQGEIQRAVFQSEDYLLARQQLQSGQTGCALLGTDQQRSVLHGLNPTQQQAFAYSPYGFRPPQLDLPGFNGEQPDALTGHYLLGNGYRAFNPVLMRFNSPDSLSPFGDGGLNAYAYCGGDPVNRVDPTGHTNFLVKFFLRRAGFMSRSSAGPIAGGAGLSQAVRSRPVEIAPQGATPAREAPLPSYAKSEIANINIRYRYMQKLRYAMERKEFLDHKLKTIHGFEGAVTAGAKRRLKIENPPLFCDLGNQARIRRDIRHYRSRLGLLPGEVVELPARGDAVSLRAGN